jgi:hypothetical protein
MAFCKNCGKELKKGEKCSCEKDVKFCKSCGKKLVGDEVCDCTDKKENTSSTNFDIVETLKEIKDDLITSLKKPVKVIKDNTDANNTPKTYVLLVLIAVTFGLFISSLFKSLIVTVIDMVAGSYSSFISDAAMDAINIPYLKIIAYGTIIYAIILAVYGLIMLLIPSIFKNKKISFKEALTLTTSAFAPMIWANVICAVLGFLAVNTGLILILYMVAYIIVSYNFVYAYGKYTEVDENKFGYTIALLIVLASIISGICTYAISKNMVESITNDIVDIDTDDIDDLLDF